MPVPLGYGVTGHAAATGESLLVNDAAKCEFAQQIPGTEQIDESVIAVPLRYGSRVIGVDRDLEARPRPVRRGRRAPARGARRPRVGRTRERPPLRGTAARGGAARRRCSSSARELSAPESRRGHRANRQARRPASSSRRGRRSGSRNGTAGIAMRERLAATTTGPTPPPAATPARRAAPLIEPRRPFLSTPGTCWPRRGRATTCRDAVLVAPM